MISENPWGDDLEEELEPDPEFDAPCGVFAAIAADVELEVAVAEELEIAVKVAVEVGFGAVKNFSAGSAMGGPWTGPWP